MKITIKEDRRIYYVSGYVYVNGEKTERYDGEVTEDIYEKIINLPFDLDNGFVGKHKTSTRKGTFDYEVPNDIAKQILNMLYGCKNTQRIRTKKEHTENFQGLENLF